MNTKFNTVKKYFDLGLWDLEKVKNSVVKGWITEADFESITSKVYKTAKRQNRC